MNLFEKIFNYQVISRLDDSGTITVTSHERAWLKTMLEHPAAAEAFTEDTKLKLVRLLGEQAPMDLSQGFIEKAKNEEKQVYHPLLRTLRRLIMKRSALRMTYRIKDGKLFTNQPGFPYKLEYSMVKKEWYLLWHHLGQRAFMSTRLQNIESVTELPFREADAEKLIAQIAAILESRKETAAIEVIPAYNRELSRILYAFSCFEKEVAYLADSDVYTITLSFRSDESEYVLSKLRFLGKRVRVVASDKLRRRMLESAAKALARYS
ncbi:WYL domain-containing protein [Paenibacillus sp. NPDC056579]|uniref:WYL domain-containing protein n=1 Tax=Paenibacillus sp. NPDC056579 TaxID=3345871 RepID=UPI0036A6556D